MNLRHLLLLSSGVWLLGCAPQVDVEAPEASGSSTSFGAPTTGSAPASSSGPVDAGTTQDQPATTGPVGSGDGGESTTEPENGSTGSESSTGSPRPLDCEPLCEFLIEGSCLQGLDGCQITCEETVRDQGPAVEQAFAACVQTEYLCFSFIEDCVWSELYGPDPVEQQYVFEGQGFDAWDGRTVFARIAGGTQASPTDSAVVVGGEVVIEASLTTAFDRFGNSRNVYLFVDVNDDGSCTPGVDHVQAVWMQSLGSAFAQPSFVIPGTPTELSSDGLCDQF